MGVPRRDLWPTPNVCTRENNKRKQREMGVLLLKEASDWATSGIQCRGRRQQRQWHTAGEWERGLGVWRRPRRGVECSLWRSRCGLQWRRCQQWRGSVPLTGPLAFASAVLVRGAGGGRFHPLSLSQVAGWRGWCFAVRYCSNWRCPLLRWSGRSGPEVLVATPWPQPTVVAI